eukprot:GHVS01077691.1.p1 GENE.GHVS01077691.1~~GHVS01077691.1.p1  ORF type:complete len:559 (-),score=140.84 GHVS01077691.1:1629-3305(-)
MQDKCIAGASRASNCDGAIGGSSASCSSREMSCSNGIDLSYGSSSATSGRDASNGNTGTSGSSAVDYSSCSASSGSTTHGYSSCSASSGSTTHGSSAASHRSGGNAATTDLHKDATDNIDLQQGATENMDLLQDATENMHQDASVVATSSSSSVVSVLRRRITSLEEENNVLVTNMSCLFVTAQQEIQRKDQTVAQLTQELAKLRGRGGGGRGESLAEQTEGFQEKVNGKRSDECRGKSLGNEAAVGWDRGDGKRRRTEQHIPLATADTTQHKHQQDNRQIHPALHQQPRKPHHGERQQPPQQQQYQQMRMSQRSHPQNYQQRQHEPHNNFSLPVTVSGAQSNQANSHSGYRTTCEEGRRPTAANGRDVGSNQSDQSCGEHGMLDTEEEQRKGERAETEAAVVGEYSKRGVECSVRWPDVYNHNASGCANSYSMAHGHRSQQSNFYDQQHNQLRHIGRSDVVNGNIPKSRAMDRPTHSPPPPPRSPQLLLAPVRPASRYHPSDRSNNVYNKNDSRSYENQQGVLRGRREEGWSSAGGDRGRGRNNGRSRAGGGGWPSV